jgi:uncharacterized protein (TIGR03435 family)
MRIIHSILLATFVSLAAFGQTAAPRLEFEVVSIKPAEPINAGDPQINIGLHIDGAQVRLGYRSLQDLIRQAYGVKAHQVEGPDWIVSQRFDISAKLPAGATALQVPEMLKSLLADRFQLTTHRGSKELPVLALVVAKGGLRMKELPPDPEAGDVPKGNVDVAASGSAQGVSMSMGNGASYTFGNNRFDVKKMTMAFFADSLSRYEADPVLDMTGLSGAYDFGLELTPEDYRAMLIRTALAAGVQLPPEAVRLLDAGVGDSLAAGLANLGLKLERRKAATEMIVVDKALKTPTEN